jgi:hypothetical protein
MTTETIVGFFAAVALVAAIVAVAAFNYEANVAALVPQRTPAVACAQDWSVGYSTNGPAILGGHLSRTLSMRQYARC